MAKIKYITNIYTVKYDVRRLINAINVGKNKDGEKNSMKMELEDFSNSYLGEELKRSILTYLEEDKKIIILLEKYGQVNYLKQTIEEILGGEEEVESYFFNPRYLKKSLLNFTKFMNSQGDGYKVLFHAGETIQTPGIKNFISIRTEKGEDYFKEQIDKVLCFNNEEDINIFDFAYDCKVAGNCIEIKRSGKIGKNKNIELFDECSHIPVFFNELESKILTCWDIRYEELVEYKNKNGHCFVGKSNKVLNIWTTNQRSNFKEMCDMRRFKLDKIGFCWDFREELWNSKYEELAEYKNKNGHIKVKRCEAPELYEWISSQKCFYKEGTLSDERIKRLTSIGFTWKNKEVRMEEIWDAKLEDLVEYKNKNGHTSIPRSQTEFASLRNWIHTQRANYKKGTIQKNRADKLNAIGFSWCEKKVKW